MPRTYLVVDGGSQLVDGTSVITSMCCCVKPVHANSSRRTEALAWVPAIAVARLEVADKFCQRHPVYAIDVQLFAWHRPVQVIATRTRSSTHQARL